jgi:hypothetical protein
MNAKNTEIVEINGVKFEIDLSKAKLISEFQIGDKVNVLVKDYSEYKVYPGIITGFNNFQSLPTITICYLNLNYSEVSLKFIQFNNETKDVQITPCNISDVMFNKADIIAKMEREIIKKQEETKDLEMKLNFFQMNFKKHFEEVLVKA